MLITAPWFRQARCITFPEMVEKRYGPGLQQFYAVINVFFGIIGSGIQIWALSSFCASVFGLSVQATIIAIGIVAVLYSMNLLPQGLTAMVVVAIFAGAMSSLATGLNANAAMVTQDIHPFLCRLFKKPVRDNVARVGFGRMATLLSGMLLILLGLMFSIQKDLGVFETIMTMNALLWIPSMAPLFLGILIRKTPRWAGFVSISCGFATSLYMYLSGLFGHPCFPGDGHHRLGGQPFVISGDDPLLRQYPAGL